MKLFEASWFDDYKYFERYFDTDLDKSVSDTIDSRHEYFEPSGNGSFSLITDSSSKFERRLGKSSDSKDHHGVTTPIYRNIRDNYWKYKNYNSNPRVVYLDIETRAVNKRPDVDNAPEQITLIQMLIKDAVIVLGLRDWEPRSDYPLDINVKYIKFDTEYDMIIGFLDIFKKIDPLIIYAWNGEGFDFPYIFNRIRRLGLNVNRLSNYGSVSLQRIELPNGLKIWKLKSCGHYFTDMMEVYKKFVTSPRPSYSLDSIASIEVHSNKVDHNEFPTFDSFYTGEKYTISEEPYTEPVRELIRQCMIKRSILDKNSDEYRLNEERVLKYINFQFVYYGIKDVILLRDIDNKLSLTKIMLNIAQTMGVLITDVMGTVKPWSQYIGNVAYFEGKVMCKVSDSQQSTYSGGFVREPIKGKHKWVMNFDVNSMYPQLSIAGFGMSPENLVSLDKLPSDLRDLIIKYYDNDNEQERLKLSQTVLDKTSELLKKYNLSMCVNGVCFRKELGIIPRLVNEIYDNRKKDKKEMFEYEQLTVKIGTILSERGIKVEA